MRHSVLAAYLLMHQMGVVISDGMCVRTILPRNLRLRWRLLWGFFFWVFPRYNSTAAMQHWSSTGFVLPMQAVKVFCNIGESPG